MTRQPQRSIEEQLRRYADAIDPALSADTTALDDPLLRPRPDNVAAALVPFEEAGSADRPSLRVLAGSLAAVAAVLVLVLVLARPMRGGNETILVDLASETAATAVNETASRPGPAPVIHVVEAGDTMSQIAFRYGLVIDAIVRANPGLDPNMLQVGQELSIPGPRVQSLHGEPVPLPSGNPIIWPFGTADVHETVERFLDESFSEWRAEALSVMVLATEPRSESGNVAHAVILDADEVFATVELRFADGRWFIRSITSPLIQVVAALTAGSDASSKPSISGSFMAARAGIVEIELVAPVGPQLVASAERMLSVSDVGSWHTFELAPAHRLVQVTLTSPAGDLIAIHASSPDQIPRVFSAAPAVPAGEDLVSTQSGIGCEGGGCGFWLTREEQLAVMMAEYELLDECMADRGEQYVHPTSDELVELHGGWSPSAVLGIGREAAAARLGYRDAGWGGRGSPAQTAASEVRSADERVAYDSALARCWEDVDDLLRPDGPPALIANELFRDGFAGESFAAAPELSAALATWRACVQAAVGIEAGVPNDLARQFGAGPGFPTDREREVAVADARCQRDADLERAFYTARVNVIIDDEDDRTTAIHEYAKRNLQMVLTAGNILAMRGITPPALD